MQNRTFARMRAAVLWLSFLVSASCTDSVTLETYTVDPEGPVLRIDPILDVANSTSEEIGPAGGIIAMTDINGALYTLEVPPNVLRENTRITMTPVIGTSGLPSSVETFWGAQFEPEGLMMVEPSILTVDMPTGVPAEQIAGLGWQGTGEDLYLTPAYPVDSQLRFPISHFSGIIVARGVSEDLKNVISVGQRKAAESLAEMLEFEQEVLRELCIDVDLDLFFCVRAAENFDDDYLRLMTAKAIPLLAQWLDAIHPDIGADLSELDARALAQDYYTWLHAAVGVLCGIGELECQRFYDEFGVFAETLRRIVANALVDEVEAHSENCNDIDLYELTGFLAFTDNPSIWGLTDVFRERLEVEPDSLFQGAVNAMRNRYACHLEIEVTGFPGSFTEENPEADISIQLRNRADPLGFEPLQDIDVEFTTRTGDCGSVEEPAYATDETGRINNIVISAEDCTSDGQEVVLRISVEDRTGVSEIHQFYLGRTIELRAPFGDPCVPVVQQSARPDKTIATPGLVLAADVCIEERIVFVAGPEDEEDLFVMNSDGTNITSLTSTSSVRDFHPDWSPDGSQIAFTASPSDVLGQADIVIMGANGSGGLVVAGGGEFAQQPSWSPDGTRLALSQTAGGSFQIHVVNADGTGFQLLPGATTDGEFEPDWSPDGTQIIYRASDGGDRIVIMSADGSGRSALTDPAEIIAHSPAWSPDGSMIAFRGGRTGEVGLFVMDANGTNIRLVTPSSTQYDSIGWSADSSRLYFMNDWDIFGVDLDGGNLVNLTNSPGAVEVNPDVF